MAPTVGWSPDAEVVVVAAVRGGRRRRRGVVPDSVELGVEPLAEDGLAVGLRDAGSPQLVGDEEQDERAPAQEDPAQYAGDEPPSHVLDTTQAWPVPIGMAGYTRLVQVLFVCTANMCRSPMAAALFGAFPRSVGTTPPRRWRWPRRAFSPAGHASPPEVVTVMAELGIDLSRHRSTQVSPELVAASDVVVAMARRHAARSCSSTPSRSAGRSRSRSSCVGETGWAGALPEETLDAWLGRLHDGRQRTDLVGRSDEDDVSDPLGGPSVRVPHHGA